MADLLKPVCGEMEAAGPFRPPRFRLLVPGCSTDPTKGYLQGSCQMLCSVEKFRRNRENAPLC
jgi:hypothetical protein